MPSKFNVVVDAPLNKTQVAALNKDIQALVMKHIAKIDNGQSILGQRLRIDPEWLGIWLKDFKTLDALKKNVNFKKVTIR